MTSNNRKHLQGKQIKVFTRSFSLELYIYAAKLFETAEIPVVRLTDKTADGYFYAMLKDEGCDIAINIDEDAFVVSMDAVLDLADYMLQNNYANCGMPDGGALPIRGHNPIVTNPFFNILHLEKIREQIHSLKDIKQFDVDAVKEEMIKRFPQEVRLVSNYNFDSIDPDPYYPFFLWLAHHFKTLYLPCSQHADGSSTVLYTPDNKELCKHSWYSRFYKVNKFHTRRIERLINEVYSQRGEKKPEISFTKRLHIVGDMLIRYIIKVVMRILGWPRKWKKWYRRYQRNREG